MSFGLKIFLLFLVPLFVEVDWLHSTSVEFLFLWLEAVGICFLHRPSTLRSI